MTDSLTFESLVRVIQATDTHFRVQAVRAVNRDLTLRNWCFGLYIAEFELRGADRARYGERLLDDLSQALKRLGISNVGRRQLYQYLTFYRTYPHIVRSLPAPSRALLAEGSGLQEIVRTASAQSLDPPDTRVGSLSYSHFELLIGLDDDLKRRFYELGAIRGQWSVRELRRQIASLAFERTALSTDKARLLEQIRQAAEADHLASSTSIWGSSTPTSTGSASTRWPKATTRPWACCSARARTTP
jgi:hypothetical protein